VSPQTKLQREPRLRSPQHGSPRPAFFKTCSRLSFPEIACCAENRECGGRYERPVGITGRSSEQPSLGESSRSDRPGRECPLMVGSGRPLSGDDDRGADLPAGDDSDTPPPSQAAAAATWTMMRRRILPQDDAGPQKVNWANIRGPDPPPPLPRNRCSQASPNSTWFPPIGSSAVRLGPA
jgi:hypothetical protein